MGLTINPTVETVRQSVVEFIAQIGRAEFGGEFIFVREDGEVHALSAVAIAQEIDDTAMVAVYEEVTNIIANHNKANKLQVVGLVHSSTIGEEEGEPHLMVVSLDNTGHSAMTLFPIGKDDVLGEPVEGGGYSPNLDPWAEEAGRAKLA